MPVKPGGPPGGQHAVVVRPELGSSAGLCRAHCPWPRRAARGSDGGVCRSLVKVQCCANEDGGLAFSRDNVKPDREVVVSDSPSWATEAPAIAGSVSGRAGRSKLV